MLSPHIFFIELKLTNKQARITLVKPSEETSKNVFHEILYWINIRPTYEMEWNENVCDKTARVWSRTLMTIDDVSV